VSGGSLIKLPYVPPVGNLNFYYPINISDFSEIIEVSGILFDDEDAEASSQVVLRLETHSPQVSSELILAGTTGEYNAGDFPFSTNISVVVRNDLNVYWIKATINAFNDGPNGGASVGVKEIFVKYRTVE
jgi:hypothetical protein